MRSILLLDLYVHFIEWDKASFLIWHHTLHIIYAHDSFIVWSITRLKYRSVNNGTYCMKPYNIKG
jgi:hypothetical protein